MTKWEGEFKYKGDPFYARIECVVDEYCINIIKFDIIDIDDINVFDPPEEMLEEIEYRIQKSLEEPEDRNYK